MTSSWATQYYSILPMEISTEADVDRTFAALRYYTEACATSYRIPKIVLGPEISLANILYVKGFVGAKLAWCWHPETTGIRAAHQNLNRHH